MINLSVVEQAVKQVMANQVTAKKWTWVRQIKTYGGEFDDGLTAIVKGFPAIWVVFEGSGTPKKISYNKTQYPVTFVVLVGARSVRNEEARRQGAGGDIGTYEMLHHVHQLLIGNDLSSVGVKGLEPLELGKKKPFLILKLLVSRLVCFPKHLLRNTQLLLLIVTVKKLMNLLVKSIESMSIISLSRVMTLKTLLIWLN